MGSYLGKLRVGGALAPVSLSALGTCVSSAATAAKVVSLPEFDTLIEGVTINVLFSATNTASAPTLNVNGTGDVPIYAKGTQTLMPGTDVYSSWAAGEIVSFTYLDEAWRMTAYKGDRLGVLKEATDEIAADIETLNDEAVRTVAQTFDAAAQAQARQNIAAAFAPLKFTGLSATFGSGGSGDYPYRAAVALTGVTANMFAVVAFPKTQAESGNYSPYCQTYDGGVYLYSSATGTVTGITVVVQRWDA